MRHVVDGFVGPQGLLKVLRHDKVQGGTKRLVLDRLLGVGLSKSPELQPTLFAKSVVPEYVYPSPAYGYAQVALGAACKAVGAQATVFVAKRKEATPQMLLAIEAGVKMVPVTPGYLSVVKARARAYAEERGATLLPFGFDMPEFCATLTSLAREVREQIGVVSEVWSVAGSGTLTRALQQAWPEARFYAAQIGRELRGEEAGRAEVIRAPERFEQAAKIKPPFPSAVNYDAKAWRFVREHHAPGALFWNVAA